MELKETLGPHRSRGSKDLASLQLLDPKLSFKRRVGSTWHSSRAVLGTQKVRLALKSHVVLAL